MNALLGCQEWHISTSTTGGGEGDGSSVRNDQSIKTGLQLDAWQEVSAQLEAVADGEAELSFAKFPENVSANQLQIQLPDDFSRRAISSTQAIRSDETLVLTGFADRSSSGSRSSPVGAGFAPFPWGGVSGGTDRSEQVLLVTAQVGRPLGISEMRTQAAPGVASR